MSYECWRKEVELGRAADWNEERNDYDPPPQQPERRPSGKFPVSTAIPEKLRDDAKKDDKN